ncbi:hypothetical protein GW17_00055409 [Ensete ventricosum]|nr:hypothetical protein GW17_00055409 [Ensete ventricosum]
MLPPVTLLFIYFIFAASSAHKKGRKEKEKKKSIVVTLLVPFSPAAAVVATTFIPVGHHFPLLPHMRLTCHVAAPLSPATALVIANRRYPLLVDTYNLVTVKFYYIYNICP